MTKKNNKTNKTSKACKSIKPSNTHVAAAAIARAMSENGLRLYDMYVAMNAMIKQATRETILNLRKSGKSIKAIAKRLHMDDKRVSAIIKSAKICTSGKSCCASKKHCAKAKAR